MEAKQSLRASNNNKRLLWTKPELEIIAKFAGKVSIDELTAKINAVSKIRRDNTKVTRKANRMGWSVMFKG